MKRFLLPFLLLLAPFAEAEPIRVMPLGDSLTEAREAREFLAARLDAAGYVYEFVGSKGQAPLKHEGHSGFTIGPDSSEPGNIADNIDQWVTEAKPDIILLLAGNNDFNTKPGSLPETAPQRLEQLLERIGTLAPDCTVVVGSVLKIGWVKDYAGALNREIPGIAEKRRAAGQKVIFADLHSEVDLIAGAQPFNGPDSDFTDGTHLNAKGAQKLADGWFAHLEPLLKARAATTTAATAP